MNNEILRNQYEENEDLFVNEFEIDDIWTTGCALNTTGKVDM